MALSNVLHVSMVALVCVNIHLIQFINTNLCKTDWKLEVAYFRLLKSFMSDLQLRDFVCNFFHNFVSC